MNINTDNPIIKYSDIGKEFPYDKMFYSTVNDYIMEYKNARLDKLTDHDASVCLARIIRRMEVNGVPVQTYFKEELDSAGGNTELVETFKKKGGIPNFSQQFTIFGQVYDGFDAYDKICSVKVTDDESLRPVDEIKIDRAYLTTYAEHRNDSFFDPDADMLDTAEKVVTDGE